MYVQSMKDDYTLFDAFQTLGIRLYGTEWTGYEVWRHRIEDPSPILDARAPLKERVEQLATLLSKKSREQKDVIGKKEIDRVNNEINELKRERDGVYNRLHEIGDVDKSEVDDYGRWERFEYAEGIFLKALCNGDIRVFDPFGMIVKESFWAEMPEGFGYDLECSLIFWPSRESAKQMGSGRIKQKQFEDWLETLMPIVPHDGANISDEQRAYIWLKEAIKSWDGKTTRDQFKEMAIDEYPGLGERAFKRIWDACATPQMKRPGARKSS